MTTLWQSNDKRMLTCLLDQSTKGGGNILYHSPTDCKIIPIPELLREVPESEFHDEDLYRYKILRGAIPGKSQ